MADYFTNFSLVMKLSKDGQQYALDLATKATTHRFDSEQLPADFPPHLALVLEWWDFETELDKAGIWLHSQNGGIDAVCVFIQHLLQKFDPKASVTFEWSHDCTKPRLDAYGGGAALITVKEIKSMSTSNWLMEVAGEKE
jgi:hypothetical protein